MMLLSRDEFRQSVFERDNYTCVMCDKPAADAHHIIERRLFSDSGYYLDNGASLCKEHHIAAETTLLSCDEIREKCRIKNIILPSHLYDDFQYDKWGNIILPAGQRLKGELFHDESVQKIIKPVLHLFINRVKYPRTHHLPFSPGVGKGDRIIENMSGFENEEIVVTVKYDGEQMNVYNDGFHARSIDSGSHPSRNWFWRIHNQIGHDIPEGYRICGENLYAVHSIKYNHLPSHFLLFAIYNNKNECLSWDETLEWTALLNLKAVDELYRGQYDEQILKNLYRSIHNNDTMEGFVVRVTRKFNYSEHKKVVAKYVRQNHVQTDQHWIHKPIEINGLEN